MAPGTVPKLPNVQRLYNVLRPVRSDFVSRETSPPPPLCPFRRTRSAMTDRTTDVENASDGKEGSGEITVERGPHFYEDNVPRGKGIFRKARFFVS